MCSLQLRLLGGLEWRTAAGAALRLPTRKAEALLAYLAVQAPMTHRRESLAGLLWGNVGDSSALASLRQALSLIGKASPQPLLEGSGRGVSLVPGVLGVDVADFEAAASRLEDLAALQTAAALYRGELLAGLDVNEAAFQDWLGAARSRLRERAIQVQLHLAAALEKAGELEHAVQAALRLLQIDPLAEAGHRSLMRLYAQQGRRAAALRQYQACVNVLQRELGAEPELPTRQLYNDLVRGGPIAGGADGGSDAAKGSAKPASRRLSVPVPDVPLHETPLIGRAAELDLVVQTLAPASTLPGALQGHVAVVLGEAGIGKTRLLEEVTAQALAQGVRVMQARGHESQQLFPLAPWVDMLRAAGATQDPALLRRLDAPWRDELANLLPELGTGPRPVEDDGSAPARQARLFEAIVQLLGLMVAQPSLLLFEDLHWSDDISLRLLAVLARRAHGWPLTILATVRDEAVSPSVRRLLRELAAQPRMRRIELGPLSQRETGQLVAALRRSDADGQAGAGLADRVWRASEGNPFVVVEAVRAIGTDPAQLSGPALALPQRVRELIRSHMEGLSDLAWRIVALVAVAGREVDFALLQRAVGEPEGKAAEALEELVRRRVLRLVGESFDFMHARIRQAVADDWLEPTRRSLHLAMAQALESLPTDEQNRAADRLAYHYAQTHEHTKAVHYLVALAHRIAHDGAHEQALQALDQALDHLSRHDRHAPPPDTSLRRELLMRQARCLFFLGRFQEVLSLLQPEQTAVEAARDSRLAAAYYLRLGSTRTYLGQHAQAVNDANRALHEATACADRASMGKAHFLLALESFWARPEQGVQHGQQAVALLEGTPERWWLGQACWILGLNLSYRGHFSQALAMEARAHALAQTLSDRRLASYAAWTTGFIHTLAGTLDAAVPACRLSVELALDPLNRMTAQGMLALAHVARGEAALAQAVLAEATPLALKFGIPQLHGLFLTFGGEAALQQGDLAAARQLATQGEVITRQAGYAYGRGWSQRVLGRIALAEGDAAAARHALAQAIVTFDDMGAPFEAGRTRIELATWLKASAADPEALGLDRAGRAALRGLGLG